MAIFLKLVMVTWQKQGFIFMCRGWQNLGIQFFQKDGNLQWGTWKNQRNSSLENTWQLLGEFEKRVHGKYKKNGFYESNSKSREFAMHTWQVLRISFSKKTWQIFEKCKKGTWKNQEVCSLKHKIQDGKISKISMGTWKIQ